MKFFRDASLKRKQMLIILLTTSVALALACAAFTAYEVLIFRTTTLREVTTMAKIIGYHSAAALDFNDARAANDTLAALKEEPSVVAAWIYLSNGGVFATYERTGGGTPDTPKFQMQGHHFSREGLTLFESIIQNHETAGMVCIISDARALYSRLAKYALIVTAVFTLTLLVAFFLSASLQRLISGPILDLLETARVVARDKNYSVRAKPLHRDELGALVGGFNEMLAQIQERDAALQKTGDELEHRVQERTHELANSLSLIHATLESTTDGILVTSPEGNITHMNGKFVNMCQIPPELAATRDGEEFLRAAVTQVKDPLAFMARIKEVSQNPEKESFDLIEFCDGRIIERYSMAQRIGEQCVGRVWNFRDVTGRKHSEQELEKAHRQLLEISRQAGMAEVATSVLHNVGNVLNSVNVSSSLISEKMRRSRLVNLSKALALMEAHKDGLPEFFAHDPKGRQLPDYLSKLALHLQEEHAEILAELTGLTGNIEHIKEIVAMQQNYARVVGVQESLDASALVEDAVRMNAGALDRHQVRVVRDYQSPVMTTVDKHKVLQILVNLIRNAKYALDDGNPPEKLLTLQVAALDAEWVRISVSDNGVGIPAENLTRIFGHGFTTRKDGHGFGLHGGALAARELGGSLTVHSDGPGRGATFTLEFPREPRKQT